ncbi:MAG: rhomboid family intramembrane serine protease [Cyanobacteria bacterium P01_A01_bin.84]
MTFESDSNEKLTCQACNQIIKVEDKVCPYCGHLQEEINSQTDGETVKADLTKENNPDTEIDISKSVFNSDEITSDEIAASQAPTKLERVRGKFNFKSIIVWGCIVMYIITLFADLEGVSNQGGMNILVPSGSSLIIFGATGAYPIFELGRWWTVLSSAWLHGNLVHIGFNLAWVNQLAPMVRKGFGARKLVIIYTFSTLTCALLTSTVGRYNPILPGMLRGADVAVGASGGIFGLLAALVAYGQITGNSAIRKQFWTFALVTFFVGFIMPRVDNWGHLGGFLGGYVASFLPWLSPKTKETKAHLIVAIACIASVVVSLVLSVGQVSLLLREF